jgi:hypothetical protein
MSRRFSIAGQQSKRTARAERALPAASREGRARRSARAVRGSETGPL